MSISRHDTAHPPLNTAVSYNDGILLKLQYRRCEKRQRLERPGRPPITLIVVRAVSQATVRIAAWTERDVLRSHDQA